MSSTDLRATTIHVKQNKYEFSRTISDHPDHTHTPQRRYDLQKCSLNKFSAKHHSKKYIFLQIHNSAKYWHFKELGINLFINITKTQTYEYSCSGLEKVTGKKLIKQTLIDEGL